MASALLFRIIIIITPLSTVQFLVFPSAYYTSTSSVQSKPSPPLRCNCCFYISCYTLRRHTSVRHTTCSSNFYGNLLQKLHNCLVVSPSIPNPGLVSSIHRLLLSKCLRIVALICISITATVLVYLMVFSRTVGSKPAYVIPTGTCSHLNEFRVRCGEVLPPQSFRKESN